MFSNLKKNYLTCKKFEFFSEENFWVNAEWETDEFSFFFTPLVPQNGIITNGVFRWGNGQEMIDEVHMSENNGGPCINARIGYSNEYYVNDCNRLMYFLCEY